MFEAVGVAVLFGLPSWEAVKLACQKAVFICPTVIDNCRAPGRILDTLLPISNAEYPAFYPLGIKTSFVWQSDSVREVIDSSIVIIMMSCIHFKF
jgi:hypothetical protein